MKCMSLVLVLLAASPAFANDVDPTGFDQQAFVGSKSRAQVQDELRQAQASGEISWQPTYGTREAKATAHSAGKSRADVASDLASARAQRELAYGETSYPGAAPSEEHGQSASSPD